MHPRSPHKQLGGSAFCVPEERKENHILDSCISVSPLEKVWGILTWHETCKATEEDVCQYPWWCQSNAKIWQTWKRLASNMGTERDSIFLVELIRCGFMTLHSLITSGRQYWCLGFRSVEGSEGESLVWLYGDSWPLKFMAETSLWREAAQSALQLAVFIIDGMAGNHCDSWTIIFMTGLTLSFQGKRPGTALNCTWLWLMA